MNFDRYVPKRKKIRQFSSIQLYSQSTGVLKMHTGSYNDVCHKRQAIAMLSEEPHEMHKGELFDDGLALRFQDVHSLQGQ